MTKSIFFRGGIVALLISLTLGAIWLSGQQAQPPSGIFSRWQNRVETAPDTPTISPHVPAPAAPTAIVAGPSVGLPLATPSTVILHNPTTVIVTAAISPNPISNSVNLLLLGATTTILGLMQDSGGGIYTLQTTFNPAAAGQIQLQVSAAFQGILKRVLSPVLIIPVWAVYTSPAIQISFEYPSTWSSVTSVDSNYLTSGDVEVLDISTSTLGNATSLQQLALADISINNCPAVDANGDLVDHILSSNSNGVLYELSCSATTDDYIYVLFNTSGQVVKLTYHDNFDPTTPESQQVSTFQQLITTLKLQ